MLIYLLFPVISTLVRRQEHGFGRVRDEPFSSRSYLPVILSSDLSLILSLSLCANLKLICPSLQVFDYSLSTILSLRLQVSPFCHLPSRSRTLRCNSPLVSIRSFHSRLLVCTWLDFPPSCRPSTATLCWRLLSQESRWRAHRARSRRVASNLLCTGAVLRVDGEDVFALKVELAASRRRSWGCLTPPFLLIHCLSAQARADVFSFAEHQRGPGDSFVVDCALLYLCNRDASSCPAVFSLAAPAAMAAPSGAGRSLALDNKDKPSDTTPLGVSGVLILSTQSARLTDRRRHHHRTARS